MKSTQVSDKLHERDITMIASWSYDIKVVELIYNPKEDQYFPSGSLKKTILQPNNFIAGSSFFTVRHNKSLYLSLIFDHTSQIKEPHISIIKTSDLADKNYAKKPDAYHMDAMIGNSLHEFKDTPSHLNQDTFYQVVGAQNYGVKYLSQTDDDYFLENRDVLIFNPVFVYQVSEIFLNDV